MRKREALRRLALAEADIFDARRAKGRAVYELAAMKVHIRALLRDLSIAEDALEAERQWRLTSLPALLAAEERAVNAEAEVARLEELTYVNDSLTRCFPELRTNRALAAAYHAGVVVACTECGGRLDGSDDVHRGGTIGPDGHVPWAVHDRCYDTFLTQLDALAGDPS